jgi:nicotinate-nucleotide pyrophosphorylase (carboxylating)
MAKSDGIICGMEIAKLVFDTVSGNTCVWEPLLSDGDFVKNGTPIAKISGEARDILSGERTALNFMQRMSGVATLTHRYVSAISGTEARILDTRKTIPGWRALDKYAVRIGGGYNHRMGLYDMALIKDNHIAAAGGIYQAIALCRNYISENTPLEVEADTIQQVIEILECPGVQRIMFDNFTPIQTRAAVELVNGRCETETSGGINLDTIKAYAETGVDYISVGALTHSAPALDISLDLDPWLPKS